MVRIGRGFTLPVPAVTLDIVMNTITIEVPATVSIDLKKNGVQSLSLEGKSTDWLAWAIAFGVRQACGDADASMKEDSEADRAKAIKDKFDKIAAGNVPAGGGSRKTPDEVGLLAALEQVEFTPNRIKTGEKTDSGKDKTKAEHALSVAKRYAEQLAADAESELTDEGMEYVLNMLRESDAYKRATGQIKDEFDTSGFPVAGKKPKK